VHAADLDRQQFELRRVRAIQAILGHKTIAMTMRYAHKVTSNLHRMMADFGAKSGVEPGTNRTTSIGAPRADLPISHQRTENIGRLGWWRGLDPPRVTRKFGISSGYE
jgi:hypothetical protein